MDVEHRYNPGVFEVGSLDNAKKVILTREEGPRGSTDERWRKETPFLVDLCKKHLDLNDESVVLDFGCGIGRLARELIKSVGCTIIGADISTSMRALGASYVNSPNFVALHPDILAYHDVDFGFTHALCIWVLQHSFEPQEDIDLIWELLPDQARILFVNQYERAVPTIPGPWSNDGFDVEAAVSKKFSIIEEGKLSQEVCPSDTFPNLCYWKILERT